MKKKPKQNLVRLVFGRTTVIIVLLLLQIIALGIYYLWFWDYAGYYYSLMTVLSVFGIIWVVNDKTEPSFRMTWLVLIAAAPVFGVAMYVYVKLQVGTKVLNRRLGSIIRETKSLLKQE